MNILVFGNGSLSIADQEHKLSLEFAKMGHCVYLLCNKKNRLFDSGKTEEHKNLITIDLPFQEYRYEHLTLDHKPDVCIGMDQSVSPFVAEYRDRARVPSYCMFLDLPIHVIDGKDAVNYNPTYSQRYYYWINCALELDGVIFNNSVAVDEFKRRYKRKAHLVFYSVSQDNALDNFDYSPSKDYVFGCNRIISYKRTDLALQAIRRTDYAYKHSFVSGDKVEMEKTYAIANASPNKFMFYEKASEDRKMELFYNAKLTVYPQMTEWIGGLSILESWSVKTPGVCFDYPVLRELYADCVLYVKPGSVIQLREAITQLYEDEDLSADLIEKGYNRFKQYFTRKVMAESLLEVIENG